MNWKQELAQAQVIDDLNANSAELVFDIWYQDRYDTSDPLDVELIRPIRVKAPEQVDARLVDQKNYLAGDLILRIDFQTMMEARKPLPSDPPLSNNGIGKTLDDFRPYNPTTGGISVGEDRVKFGGVDYVVAQIEGDKWLGNEPAVYLLTLRRK